MPRFRRLPCWDYADPGVYFITVCCQNRKSLFGSISNGKTCLNWIGRIADSCWLEIPQHFPDVELDEYIVMPNHVHGLMLIPYAGPADNPRDRQIQHSISSIMGSYKSAITRTVNQQTPQQAQVWQRSFYDHIVRDEPDLMLIREYIVNNPMQWTLDGENPQRTGLSKQESQLFDK